MSSRFHPCRLSKTGWIPSGQIGFFFSPTHAVTSEFESQESIDLGWRRPDWKVFLALVFQSDYHIIARSEYHIISIWLSCYINTKLEASHYTSLGQADMLAKCRGAKLSDATTIKMNAIEVKKSFLRLLNPWKSTKESKTFYRRWNQSQIRSHRHKAGFTLPLGHH